MPTTKTTARSEARLETLRSAQTVDDVRERLLFGHDQAPNGRYLPVVHFAEQLLNMGTSHRCLIELSCELMFSRAVMGFDPECPYRMNDDIDTPYSRFTTRLDFVDKTLDLLDEPYKAPGADKRILHSREDLKEIGKSLGHIFRQMQRLKLEFEHGNANFSYGAYSDTIENARRTLFDMMKKCSSLIDATTYSLSIARSRSTELTTLPERPKFQNNESLL